MSLFQTLLTRVYREDWANHYMRGSLAAGIGASVSMPAAVMLIPSFALGVAALSGIASAYLVGRWKERRDKQANDKADALGQPRPHGVETADWQFTAWGALPVALPLVVLQALLLPNLVLAFRA